ncbi:M20 family metallopeptidase [Solibacillus daqui]|uniref:M20 family metallopeptidase n=1 Tax=Solibacillus daqui TaxID=2912187 RepID=UPI00236566C1|nr:M20 family metallopeptidase [Solibacillus daqui]
MLQENTIEAKISDYIDRKRDTYIQISDEIWNYAEIRFQEHQSANLLKQALIQEQFTIEENIGQMETAFIGSWGQGKPVIAILGEYDALSGLSQQGGVAQQNPIEVNGNGHGCGHNLLGTGSLAAAIATKQYMEEHQLSGTIRYYGCPAEEGGSGKTFMVRAGAFDDVDIALCWHPADMNGIMGVGTLANIQATFKFKGRASHAAVAPHLGRSALDAVELMNVGSNFLREHIIPEARLHYAITNSGGISPNIVQSEASVLYLIRAPKTTQTQEIYERIIDIAKGAALMTSTDVEVIFEKACSNVIPNDTVQQIMYNQFEQMGVPEFDDVDNEFAQKIRDTLSEHDKNSSILGKLPAYRTIEASQKNNALFSALLPYDQNLMRLTMPGSTDVGDVSWVVPTAQIVTSCHARGTQLHSWQAVATGNTPIAHKGMLQAGKVIASTAVYLFENPDQIMIAQQELKEALSGEVYESPIPQDVLPSILKNQITDVD